MYKDLQLKLVHCICMGIVRSWTLSSISVIINFWQYKQKVTSHSWVIHTHAWVAAHTCVNRTTCICEWSDTTYTCKYIAHICNYVAFLICDWLWENPPLTHKDKYLEIRNSIIQCAISWEGLKLHAYNSLQIYSHLVPLHNAQLTDFSTILDCFLSTLQALIKGWGWSGRLQQSSLIF